jgi:hypothetical protein
VIFVASQKALSAEVKAVIKQQLESVSSGWTVYRIARQASRMVWASLLSGGVWWDVRTCTISDVVIFIVRTQSIYGSCLSQRSLAVKRRLGQGCSCKRKAFSWGWLTVSEG